MASPPLSEAQLARLNHRPVPENIQSRLIRQTLQDKNLLYAPGEIPGERATQALNFRLEILTQEQREGDVWRMLNRLVGFIRAEPRVNLPNWLQWEQRNPNCTVACYFSLFDLKTTMSTHDYYTVSSYLNSRAMKDVDWLLANNHVPVRDLTPANYDIFDDLYWRCYLHRDIRYN